jgi:hypothetical protein
MRLETNRHPSEEEIEKYSLGDMSEEECSRFEEHILICEFCQNRVTESDNFVSTMQAAGAQIRQEGLKARKRWWSLPQWAATLAVAAAVLFSAVVGLGWVARRNSNRGDAQPSVVVNLMATRGNPIGAIAPAGRTLAIQLDLAGLSPESSFRVEMVNGRGERVWQGTAVTKDAVGIATVPKMARGQYFLRTYAPSGQLLREFGLEVEGL